MTPDRREPAFTPHLSTARLRLRPPSAGDAEALLGEYAADPEVTRYLTFTPHRNVATVEEYLTALLARCAEGNEHAWAITLPDDDRMFGMIGARIHGHRADLGYVLARRCWNRGYMTEAIVAVTAWLLEHPAIYRVWAVCDVDNAGSARALAKAGFAREGVLRRWIMHPNASPEPRDCLVYARVR